MTDEYVVQEALASIEYALLCYDYGKLDDFLKTGNEETSEDYINCFYGALDVATDFFESQYYEISNETKFYFSYTDTGVLLKLIFTREKLDFEATGLRIIRGEERIDAAPLPDIFTDVPAAEYELLAPLSAKAFDTENRRTLAYLEPERFQDAPEEVWNNYYNSTEPDGYYEGEHMDFHIIAPFAATAGEGAWKKSRLEKVRSISSDNFNRFSSAPIAAALLFEETLRHRTREPRAKKCYHL